MGSTVGLTIRRIVTELLNEPQNVGLKLDQDNKGTIRSILYEVTSWRTRHYADKAAWLRDVIMTEGIQVGHVPGTEIIVDPFTKVLEKIKLLAAYVKLQLRM